MLTWGTGGRVGRCGDGAIPGARLVWDWAGEGGQVIFRCRVMLRNSGGYTLAISHIYSQMPVY